MKKKQAVKKTKAKKAGTKAKKVVIEDIDEVAVSKEEDKDTGHEAEDELEDEDEFFEDEEDSKASAENDEF